MTTGPTQGRFIDGFHSRSRVPRGRGVPEPHGTRLRHVLRMDDRNARGQKPSQAGESLVHRRRSARMLVARPSTRLPSVIRTHHIQTHRERPAPLGLVVAPSLWNYARGDAPDALAPFVGSNGRSLFLITLFPVCFKSRKRMMNAIHRHREPQTTHRSNEREYGSRHTLIGYIKTQMASDRSTRKVLFVVHRRDENGNASVRFARFLNKT
jgi:hypothetical protein